MRKKLWCLVKYVSIVFFIIVIVSIMLSYTHRDKSISNGRFEAIELHSEEGNYISYAIKLAGCDLIANSILKLFESIVLR